MCQGSRSHAELRLSPGMASGRPQWVSNQLGADRLAAESVIQQGLNRSLDPQSWGFVSLPLVPVTEPALSHARLKVSFNSPRILPTDSRKIVGRVHHVRAPAHTSICLGRCEYLLVGGGGKGGGTASDNDPLYKTLSCENLSFDAN